MSTFAYILHFFLQAMLWAMYVWYVLVVFTVAAMPFALFQTLMILRALKNFQLKKVFLQNANKQPSKYPALLSCNWKVFQNIIFLLHFLKSCHEKFLLHLFLLDKEELPPLCWAKWKVVNVFSWKLILILIKTWYCLFY